MRNIYTVCIYDDIDTLVAFNSKTKAIKYLEKQLEELMEDEELPEEKRKEIRIDFKANHKKEGFNFETEDGYSHFGCIRSIQLIY